MTFISYVKIDVNMCEPHYVNLFFCEPPPYSRCLTSFWQLDIFLTTWHLFDILTHQLNLNHLSPHRAIFIITSKSLTPISINILYKVPPYKYSRYCCKVLKIYLEVFGKPRKIQEKSGNFVIPVKWEPCYWFASSQRLHVFWHSSKGHSVAWHSVLLSSRIVQNDTSFQRHNLRSENQRFGRGTVGWDRGDTVKQRRFSIRIYKMCCGKCVKMDETPAIF